MGIVEDIGASLGADRVAQGPEAARWLRDWTGSYPSDPLAVVRPRSAAEVSHVLARASAAGVPVVPVSGNTGLTGGAQARGGLMLSLDRMNRIREIRPDGRVAIVEAGVVLSALHDAAEAEGLIFPLTFGARGSAMIGGILSTNAGGSNVLRYGNTRDLCLGLEVVLADGRVMDLMSELHKDNSGLNLRHLIIGAEGTLGVITAAVLKLRPRPQAYATAMAAVADLPAALRLLNRLQDESGGMVEAFEYMPRSFIEGHLRVIEGARPPFAESHDINLLIELGATAPRDATPREDGSVPVVSLLEDVLGGLVEEGLVLDAVVARTEAQRREMWARREAAAEIAFSRRPFVDTDIALPLDRVADFLDRIGQRLAVMDPGYDDLVVAHLGDGNVHFTAYPTRDDAALKEAMREAVEDVVTELRGSFSAEHGIGQSKLGSMRRRKDPVSVEVMRAIKRALDPQGILNPGKVLPD